MTFPQAPLRPPWEVTGETGVVLPSSTHSQAVNTAAAGVAEAGQKTGLSTAQSSSCTTSSQPPDLLKGDSLATSSLCQSPPSQEINAQSHWGNRYRSTNTCVSSCSSKQLHRGWQWELLLHFQLSTPWRPWPCLTFQSSETAVLATQFLIPLAWCLLRNSLPLVSKASSLSRIRCCCSQPSHLRKLGHCLPLSS